MAEIIISLRHAYQSQEYDLEVSPDMPIDACIQQAAISLGWLTPAMAGSVGYTVEAASGSGLPLHLTFEQAGIWTGAALVFHPPGAQPPPQPPRPKAPDNQAEGGYQFVQLD